MFIKTLYKVFALSVVLTLALASAAFAQLTLPTLSIDDVTFTEGDAGTTNATFTVTRSGNTSLISTVNFTTTDDTATQPGDYASVSGILTFGTGETTKTITVSVKGDTLDEADERFFVDLSTPVSATISDNQGVGTITDDDHTPEANDDGSVASPITLTEDDPSGVSTNVLANDTGLGDTPITVQVTTSPGMGTATVNPDKTITYMTNANQNGPDTYGYTVTDLDGQTSTATVHLQITPVNDALIISSVTNDGPVGEGSPATITVAASDPDGEPLSYEFDCNNDNAFEIGPQSGNTAQCIFSDEGSYRVNARVSDGNVDAATSFTDVTVNNVAPNAVNDSASADDAGPDVAIDVLVNDTDVSGDPLTITGNTQPPAGKGSVSCSTNNCAFTPDADFNGTTSFTYTISDGDGGTDTATVAVTVAAVNHAPTISDISDQSIDEGTSTGAISFTVGDVETSAADLTVSGSSSNTTLVPNPNITFAFGGSGANRTVTVTPASGQTGTATITVAVSDGAATSTDTFVLTVNAVNDVPTVALTGPNAADEGTASSYGFTVNDPDAGDTFTLKSGFPDCGTGGTFAEGSLTTNSGGGSFRCRFPDGATSTDVRIQVADAQGADSNVATKSVTVSNIAPTITLSANNELSVNEGTTNKTYSYSVSDPGDDTVQSVDTSCGDNGVKVANSDSFNANTGSFQCRFPDGPATSVFSAEATDSDNATGNEAGQAVQIANVAPTVDLNGPTVANEGVTKTYTYTVNDVPADLANMVITEECGANGTKIDTPDPNRFDCRFPDGPANSTVKVTAVDPANDSSSDEVNITVNAVDTTAPTVTQWKPIGKKGSPKTMVTATFSEAMNKASVEAPGVFTLKKGTKTISATVVYDLNTQTATLRPTKKLRSGATYTATVLGGPSGAKDLAGSALDEDPDTVGSQSKAWKFRVR